MTIRVCIGPANQYSTGLMTDSVDDILQKDINPYPAGDMWCQQLSKDSILLKEKDPIWALWRNQKRADTLVVIADLPKNFGGADKRRVLVPLDKHLWYHLTDNTVHIEIREDGVKLLDSPGR